MIAIQVVDAIAHAVNGEGKSKAKAQEHNLSPATVLPGFYPAV